MARYHIKSYKKVKQSFLGSINSINEDTGGIREPYSVVLEKTTWWSGKSEVVKEILLPKGFDHKKELRTGREWVN